MADPRKHPAERQLTDLALLDVDESQSASLTRHLATCPQCRAAYDEILDAVAHVSATGPAARPPGGLTERVLAVISDERAGAAAALHDSGAPKSTSRRRNGARKVWFAVAAGIVGLVVGVLGTMAVLARDSTREDVTAVGAALLTSDGTRVGTVLDSRFDGRPVLVLTLAEGVVGTRYECELVLADGRRQPAGSWVLRDSAGATWVVPGLGGDEAVTRVELLRGGSTWATATL